MKNNIAYVVTFCVLTAGLLVGCEDETLTFGIPSTSDLVTTSSEVFEFTTQSVKMDSVVANSTRSYIGEIADPETNTDIKAEFLTQFYTFENYTLPAEQNMIKNEAGEVEADSVEVRLYFTDVVGSLNNPMKIQVFELDTANVIAENKTYYSNLDISQYVRPGSEPLTTKVFTPLDYELSDAVLTSTTHYHNVHIRLPRELGTRILRKALRQPQYFVNSWQFIHHVCPGFYFKLVSGRGTMLAVDVASFNIYFRYRDTKQDTTLVGLSRFSATAEVIQSTRIENQGIDQLLEDTDVPYTYLKSPAGIATLLTLPIDEIYARHQNDSISRARIVLTRLNSETQDQNALDMPANLLLLPVAQRHSFFATRNVADKETSYTTAFDQSYNTYTFSNVARLIAYLHRQKVRGMADQGLTSEQWNVRYPDWNRVLVLPVSITTSTDNTTGASTQVAVNHDFSLSSARLVGGTKPIQIQVIFSSYQ